MMCFKHYIQNSKQVPQNKGDDRRLQRRSLGNLLAECGSQLLFVRPAHKSVSQQHVRTASGASTAAQKPNSGSSQPGSPVHGARRHSVQVLGGSSLQNLSHNIVIYVNFGCFMITIET